MQRPLQISFENLADSAALDTHIRQKVDKLERFFPRLVGCQVTVALPHKHRQQGEHFTVRVDLTVPGAELVSSRQTDEDVYVALRDAFDATLRQLEDHARRERGQTKHHAPLAHGKVARLLDGYGFIEDDDGNEYYFSGENLIDHRFEQIEAGTVVQFLVETAREGLQAKRVSVGKPLSGSA